MREFEVFDTDLLKVGTKIYFKERGCISGGPDGIVDKWDDEGGGEITDSHEDWIGLIFDGYYGGDPRDRRVLSPEDMNSGFYSMTILHQL
jgi:hypothetical protein